MSTANRSTGEAFTSSATRGRGRDSSRLLTDLQQGLTLHQQGDLEGAEALYRQVLCESPGEADPLHLLGVIALQRGESGKAIDLLEQAIALRPDAVDFHVALGNAHRMRENYSAAALSYEKALRLDPRQRTAWLELAALLSTMQQPTIAMECYHQVLKLDPVDVTARVNLAALLREQGDSQRAVDLLAEVAESPLAPVEVKYNLANALVDLGQFEQARHFYEEALPAHPRPAKVLYNLIQVTRLRQADRPALKVWSDSVRERTDSADDLCHYHFAMGKGFDDLGDFDNAWGHYVIANALAGYDFDLEAHHQWISQTMTVFEPQFFEERKDWGNGSTAPVFIVGMPRSGTSLVEQILSAHSLVHAAGERREWGRMVEDWTARHGRQFGDPYAVLKLTEASTENLAQKYAVEVFVDDRAARVTDKMPTNFLLLGWIAVCFPKARIIHCRRDPRDTCLSCYFQHFTHGLPFAYDLVHLAGYYAEYERLMQHWQRVLPLPIHEVNYDELVRNPNQLVHELVDFCQLPWEPACLASHSASRVVSTASVWQVRQPIYNRSSGRWRNYEKYIDPLLAAFGSEDTTPPLSPFQP